jgi:hypothetical protein
MGCKVQIKPIKNNPLTAKLKAKKKGLRTNNPSIMNVNSSEMNKKQ